MQSTSIFNTKLGFDCQWISGTVVKFDKKDNQKMAHCLKPWFEQNKKKYFFENWEFLEHDCWFDIFISISVVLIRKHEVSSFNKWGEFKKGIWKVFDPQRQLNSKRWIRPLPPTARRWKSPSRNWNRGLQLPVSQTPLHQAHNAATDGLLCQALSLLTRAALPTEPRI